MQKRQKIVEKSLKETRQQREEVGRAGEIVYGYELLISDPGCPTAKTRKGACWKGKSGEAHGKYDSRATEKVWGQAEAKRSQKGKFYMARVIAVANLPSSP